MGPDSGAIATGTRHTTHTEQMLYVTCLAVDTQQQQKLGDHKEKMHRQETLVFTYWFVNIKPFAFTFDINRKKTHFFTL